MLIIGSNINDIVSDGRKLRAFKNRGFIKDYDNDFKYVDCYDYLKDGLEINEFYYKNETYKFKYFDGCFMPFVIKVNKKEF